MISQNLNLNPSRPSIFHL
uniref:Uncharacterized protein n=1 Tax=Rhizophora mucronata TaxID=61149 RepID=A0A2P2NVH9_RHIMU